LADYTLTVQIVDKATNQPLAWPLLLDGQHLGDTKQTYTVVLPEGNHVLELPIVVGAGYASTVWRDQAGNILSQSTVLFLNLTSDQEVTLTLQLSSFDPRLMLVGFAVVALAVIGAGSLVWWVGKKISK